VQYPQLAAKYLGIVDTTSEFGEQQIKFSTDLHSSDLSGMENADMFFEQEDYESAVAEYQRYLRLYPDDPEASKLWYMIAYCQYHLGRYDDALENITTAAKLIGEDGLPPVFWSNNCSSGATDRTGVVNT
jgi:tetratricopeptide (TPR) repeat protein